MPDVPGVQVECSIRKNKIGAVSGRSERWHYRDSNAR